jgi:hypothetical protein
MSCSTRGDALLFALGVLFAGVLTRFFAAKFFAAA